MKEAANLPGAIQFGTFFLESPNAQHLVQQEQAVLAGETGIVRTGCRFSE
jgi:hypothetical protein